jgi:hypothetical protein
VAPRPVVLRLGLGLVLGLVQLMAVAREAIPVTRLVGYRGWPAGARGTAAGCGVELPDATGLPGPMLDFASDMAGVGVPV